MGERCVGWGKGWLIAALVWVSACVGASPAWAAPGDLDPAFGSGGITFSEFGVRSPQTSVAEDVAVDGAGQIYAAGIAIDVGATKVFVARYTPSGLLDQSFGNGGVRIQQLGLGSSPDTAECFPARVRIALAPDGGVLLATCATDAMHHDEVAVMRLDGNGALEQGFGSGGILHQQLSTDAMPTSQAAGLALAPDGRIVPTGQLVDATSGQDMFFAERLLGSTGAADPTFARGGLYVRQLGSAPQGEIPVSSGADVAVQRDGKPVFVADATTVSGQSEFAVTRLTNDGGDDPSFGTTYVQTGEAAVGAGAPLRVRIEPDGRLVAAGTGTDASGHTEIALVRLTSTGVPDASFGSSGNGVLTRQFASAAALGSQPTSGVQGLAI
jgi:uncharacterized delta-60 repeat protein